MDQTDVSADSSLHIRQNAESSWYGQLRRSLYEASIFVLIGDSVMTICHARGLNLLFPAAPQLRKHLLPVAISICNVFRGFTMTPPCGNRGPGQMSKVVITRFRRLDEVNATRRTSSEMFMRLYSWSHARRQCRRTRRQKGSGTALPVKNNRGSVERASLVFP